MVLLILTVMVLVIITMIVLMVLGIVTIIVLMVLEIVTRMVIVISITTTNDRPRRGRRAVFFEVPACSCRLT